jgi:transposase
MVPKLKTSRRIVVNPGQRSFKASTVSACRSLSGARGRVRGWLRAERRCARGGELSTFAERVRALYPETVLPTYVERQLRALESQNEEIADADRELATTAKADPIAKRLMTVPGVGPSTSVRFVAALDEISRFSGAHTVESYLGLVPGEDSSAERSAGPVSPKPGRPNCAGAWSKPHGRRGARGGEIALHSELWRDDHGTGTR